MSSPVVVRSEEEVPVMSDDSFDSEGFRHGGGDMVLGGPALFEDHADLFFHTGIEHEFDLLHQGSAGEAVFDPVAWACDPGVGIGFDLACKAVADGFGISGGCEKRGFAGQAGETAGNAGEITVVFEKHLLEFGDGGSADLPRGLVVVSGEGGGGSHRLSHDGAGPHDSGAAHRGVGTRGVAACAEEIFNGSRVEAAVWNAVGRGGRVEDCGLTAERTGVEPCRVVIVHAPSAVGDDIGKRSSGFDIVLREDVIPLVASAFPLGG